MIDSCLSQTLEHREELVWMRRQKDLEESHRTFQFFEEKMMRFKAVKFHEGFVCLSIETNSRCWNR